MKWVGLVVSLIICGLALKFFLYDLYHPSAESPSGVAEAFVEAARGKDMPKINELCVAAAMPQTLPVARELATIAFNTPLQWEKTKPTTGQGAVQAQLSGASKILVIEWKMQGKAYRICRATIADF